MTPMQLRPQNTAIERAAERICEMFDTAETWAPSGDRPTEADIASIIVEEMESGEGDARALLFEIRNKAIVEQRYAEDADVVCLLCSTGGHEDGDPKAHGMVAGGDLCPIAKIGEGEAKP